MEASHGKALGFHQDSSYKQWAIPSEWVSCWIALEDTSAAQGTVEYVRGSHKWAHWRTIEEFHGPDDPHRELRMAAHHGEKPEFVPVEVAAGGARPRRLDLAWLMSTGLSCRVVHLSPTACHPRAAFTRPRRAISQPYKRFGDDEMDESFFPVIWREDGYRSPFIDPYLAKSVGWAGSPVE